MAAIAIQASFRSKWWRKTKAAKIRRGFERIRRWIARWQENNTRERKLQAAKVMCSFLSSCCKGTRVLNTVKKLRFHVKQLQRFWRSYAGVLPVAVLLIDRGNGAVATGGAQASTAALD
eukprot:TRINITY_DN97_c0_g1_i16.p4 TRINITY_DN97_c0_g1~~TRINITY_DN97_c0_g1_i16.p4  ORF type:complete len:119 (+),score=26.01 TRINITY_DN97_c0_g1_i16:1079-1435(+)